jgi:hypothetical protein
MPRGGRRQRALPDELRLPNENSPCATPTTLQLDLHYAKLQVWARWDYDRFVRTARLLGLTMPELASLACIPHRALETLKTRNHLYNGGAPDRAGALVLTLIELHMAGPLTSDVIEHLLPNLNHIAPVTPADDHARPTDS